MTASFVRPVTINGLKNGYIDRLEITSALVKEQPFLLQIINSDGLTINEVVIVGDADDETRLTWADTAPNGVQCLSPNVTINHISLESVHIGVQLRAKGCKIGSILGDKVSGDLWQITANDCEIDSYDVVNILQVFPHDETELRLDWPTDQYHVDLGMVFANSRHDTIKNVKIKSGKFTPGDHKFKHPAPQGILCTDAAGFEGLEISNQELYGVNPSHAVTVVNGQNCKLENIATNGRVSISGENEVINVSGLDDRRIKTMQINTTQDAAEELGISTAIIEAIFMQESSGDGWLADGRVKILYEQHVFYRCLVRAGHDIAKIMQENTNDWDILHPKPTKAGKYGKYTEQYDKLERAKRIDEECALMACSWGKTQILGENFRELKYSSIHDFVASVSDKDRHLEVFVRYMQAKPSAIQALRSNDFTRFAKLYNGAGSPPSYAAKLSENYRRIVARQNPRKGVTRSQTQTANAIDATVKTGGTFTVGTIADAYIKGIETSLSKADETLKQLEEIKAGSLKLQDRVTDLGVNVEAIKEASGGVDYIQVILVIAVIGLLIPNFRMLYTYMRDHGYLSFGGQNGRN